MEYSDACTELAKLIQAGHYEYPEDAGLAMILLHRAVEVGDDPAMALALAKNLAFQNAAPPTDKGD